MALRSGGRNSNDRYILVEEKGDKGVILPIRHDREHITDKPMTSLKSLDENNGCLKQFEGISVYQGSHKEMKTQNHNLLLFKVPNTLCGHGRY